MDSDDNIFTRAQAASEQRSRNLRDNDAEVLDAWLWPAAEIAKPTAAKRAERAPVEVSLLPTTKRLLRKFPVHGLERPYLRHLEQRIARDPRDLLSHVRRLFVAHALGDNDAVAGALADLFLTLGTQGRRLRRRMLRLVGRQLTSEQLVFFETRLALGLDATAKMPEIPQSRLSKRITGTTRIVSRKGDNAADADNPVRLARESLAKGHPDVAQAVLEGALESDPGDRAISEELLGLYKDRDLRSGFRKTYTALLGRKLACRDQWDALAHKFRVRVGANG